MPIFIAMLIGSLINLVITHKINVVLSEYNWECTKVVSATEYEEKATCDQWTRKNVDSTAQPEEHGV